MASVVEIERTGKREELALAVLVIARGRKRRPMLS